MCSSSHLPESTPRLGASGILCSRLSTWGLIRPPLSSRTWICPQLGVSHVVGSHVRGAHTVEEVSSSRSLVFGPGELFSLKTERPSQRLGTATTPLPMRPWISWGSICWRRGAQWRTLSRPTWSAWWTDWGEVKMGSRLTTCSRGGGSGAWGVDSGTSPLSSCLRSAIHVAMQGDSSGCSLVPTTSRSPTFLQSVWFATGHGFLRAQAVEPTGATSAGAIWSSAPTAKTVPAQAVYKGGGTTCCRPLSYEGLGEARSLR